MPSSRKQRNQLVRIICAACLFAAGLLLHLLLHTDGDSLSPLSVFDTAVFLAAYIIVGYPPMFAAVRNISKGQIFDENFLMTLATIGALCLRQWDEAVAVMLFYQIGDLFEQSAVDKSRKSISELMEIRPDHANLLRGGKEETVDPYDVAVGDTIIVRPGEKVPLDGIVSSGHGSVDASALTGESMPASVSAGDEIISGCISLDGLLEIRVSSEFGESTVSKILDLVENAGNRKAHAEKFITRFARIYTPAVVAAAAALAAVPPLFFAQPWHEWIYRALLFLIISCPCALVISVPLAFFGGVGAAGKRGILVKGSSYLEAAANLKTVIFDKTGTLTTGKFSITGISGRPETLELAALAESYSSHPIALSIVDRYREQTGKEPDTDRVSDIEEISGKGICAVIDGRKVMAGNRDLITSSLASSTSAADEDADSGSATVIYVAADGKYCGRILIADTIKPNTAAAVKSLSARTVMLTGDRQPVALAIAGEAGIDEVYSQLLPADKVEITEKILGSVPPGGGTTAFVGDGINDAPVLARADIGIAMGGLGSQAAIEAADIVIMDDDISKISLVRSIAARSVSIARENVIFALSVKALILALGAVGLADMWMAIFADVGVSIIAILNSMRTLTVK